MKFLLGVGPQYMLGAHPTNDIPIEYQIRQKLSSLYLEKYESGHDKLLPTPRQLTLLYFENFILIDW